MFKTGSKFEIIGVKNNDGTPAIGQIIRVNRFGALFYSVTLNGKTRKGGDMYFVRQGASRVVQKWVAA